MGVRFTATLTSIKDYNDGYCYILVVIDVLGKFAWVEPLKGKIDRNVAYASERIIDRAHLSLPLCVQSDRGKEFVGTAFQNLLYRRGIDFRVTRNPDIKAAAVQQDTARADVAIFFLPKHKTIYRRFTKNRVRVQSYSTQWYADTPC